MLLKEMASVFYRKMSLQQFVIPLDPLGSVQTREMAATIWSLIFSAP